MSTNLSDGRTTVPLPKRSIRLSRELDTQLDVAAKQRGFRSVSALLRAAIEKELKNRNGDEHEHKVAASVDRLFPELRRVVRAQQAQFAYLDSLTKVLLTCVPEPSGEAVEAALARDVHVALRGRNRAGKEVPFERDYIRNGLRAVTEELCTRQLGFRTTVDAEYAQARETEQ